ncbi:SDR family NAD(P)-dependent oxidoreductase [Lutimonas zeaxanthinifaciens]|uniref:SDR family NAD(P)-dependent oxidoreductase n=1 Tax=Lutimonas zeaxanthinifaciens TaxID=3060215 RepID=UPI00265D47DA|nr:SDR family NAD(P)-dependent oxidoreductase [Lutimonas sp. YSD2104]WKK65650.1 SDR family NAD(P)-dependent oxidoreductase [Lutimonas sp. YSD2104]
MERIALITGATSGIGEATAKLFAKNKINLILCGRRKERLKALESELSSLVRVRTLSFDVGNNKQVRTQLNNLEKEWKNIDILINNAGGAHGLEQFVDGSIEDWEKMIDFNLKGLLYVSKVIIPGMVTRKKGQIINISSIAGKQTYSNGLVYCASKSGVEAISKGMRLELVPHGIRVCNIAPGAVDTEFSTVRFKGDKEKANNVYKNFEPLIAQDIADCILYCVNVPPHVQIADMTIFPAAQSDATTIHRKI